MIEESHDRPSLGLTEEEAAARFASLQSGLVEQWRLIRSMNQLEQTMVVVPSVSDDLGVPASVLRAYEERMLFLLLLLRKPRARIIYCTSQQILAEIIDYYIGLLPGVIPSHARSRLLTVTVHDATQRPLALKILERPRLIERIGSLITDPETTHLVPFTSTVLERDLAVRLGIPMYGVDPGLARFGTRSVFRRLFADEGLAHPVGVEGVASASEVAEAIRTIRAARPATEQVLVKLDEPATASASDAATVTLTGLPSPGAAAEASAIADRVAAMRVHGDDASVDEFLELLAGEGGVVEERIAGDQVRGPSAQLRITPLGEVELLSTHDRVVVTSGADSGPASRFPADADYAVTITQEAMKIGHRLCQEGVLGRVEVGFVAARQGGAAWRPYATEVNLRKGHTTAPFLTLEFLTNGRYHPEQGTFTTPTGQRKCYLANDHVAAPHFRAITPDDLFDFVVRHGLHFDHTTQTGVVLHMLSAVSERGCFGLTAVADSHDEANELYERTIATLGFEAERASR